MCIELFMGLKLGEVVFNLKAAYSGRGVRKILTSLTLEKIRKVLGI